jgi:hypothetical protein
VRSHSAREDAVGEYGISKYRIERMYLDGGETVVRPGLVIGSGGFVWATAAGYTESADYAWSRQLLVTLRVIIPLVGGGRDAVPVLAIPVELGRRSAYNLFQ